MSHLANRTVIGVVSLVAIFAVTSYAQDAERKATDPRDPNKVPKSGIRETKLRVDGERIKSYIEWLARDEMQGRRTLTDGFKKAEEWAAENFRKWGLRPAGQDGTYFQDVPVERGFTFLTGVPELKIKNQTFLLEEEDFTVHPSSSPAAKIDAEVIFVGYGISAPDKGLDEYANLDVKGKIVLVLKGSPRDVNAPQGRFGPTDTKEDVSNEAWERESTERAKIQTAYDKGAAAILLFDPNSQAARDPIPRIVRGPRPGPGRTDEPKLKFDRGFLIFTINGRVFHALMKPDPQESIAGLTRRLDGMRWEIRKKKSRSLATGTRAQIKGYDTAQEYSKELHNNIARNVLARIEGTDPNLKNEYIIIGGHMDHVGVRDGLVYSGADDDASGTAVALEVGRVLGEAGYKSKRAIIFCCWCGEELGLLGSNYYTSNPCAGVTMDRVVAYFNLDMVGLGDRIGAPGALNFPSLWDVIRKNQDKDVIAAVDPNTGGPGGSDHSGFITKGIEALALMTRGGGGHPDYHQPEDDVSKIDREILRKTGQFVLQGVINLANETKTPLLIENRRWIYEGSRLSLVNINPDLEGSDWRCLNLDGYDQDRLRWRIASVEKKPERTVRLGIRRLNIFDGNVELLLAAAEALGCGRVDINGSDGKWIVNGKITEDGRYALGMLEQSRIAVNLVSPSPQLLRDVLAAATRPFLVTGFYLLDPQTYEQINHKKVVLGVKFDPQDVDGTVKRLEQAKAALGDADNLVLFVSSAEGLNEAKKDLYLALMKNGWKAEEIGSAGGRTRRGRDIGGTGIAGGNLNVLRSAR